MGNESQETTTTNIKITTPIFTQNHQSFINQYYNVFVYIYTHRIVDIRLLFLRISSQKYCYLYEFMVL